MYPEDLKYTDKHEWVRSGNGSTVSAGLVISGISKSGTFPRMFISRLNMVTGGQIVPQYLGYDNLPTYLNYTPSGFEWLVVLGGIGFTVSLLVSELSFGQGTPHDDIGKVAILTASVLAATLAAVLLGARNRHYRAVEVAEQVDADADGVPDRFQH